MHTWPFTFSAHVRACTRASVQLEKNDSIQEEYAIFDGKKTRCTNVIVRVRECLMYVACLVRRGAAWHRVMQRGVAS